MLIRNNELTEDFTEPAIDTRVKPYVRILRASLDDDPSSPSAVILNGRIDSATLRFLKIDHSYQRPLGERPDIWEAIKSGAVMPNIDIGVRGHEFDVDGDTVIIHSPAYIIDGWQRVGTALKMLEANPAQPIRIFGSVHFDTTDVWERHRFTELNKNVKKVSPNLHLRNMRDQNEAVLTLYGLSNNTKEFPLYKRVCWAQNMARGDLLAALTLVKVTVWLHSHVAGAKNNTTADLAGSLLTASRAVSLPVFRRNVHTFFNIVDECWGLHDIEFKQAAPQAKLGFLRQVARMLSRHVDFWDEAGRVLFVDADDRRKLSKFPLQDPHVKNLAGAGGAAQSIIYEMLCTHMDSGRRQNKLTPRATDRRGYLVRS